MRGKHSDTQRGQAWSSPKCGVYLRIAPRFFSDPITVRFRLPFADLGRPSTAVCASRPPVMDVKRTYYFSRMDDTSLLGRTGAPRPRATSWLWRGTTTHHSATV